MWFRKKKEVNSGIIFNDWVKDHIEDKKYLRVYIGKDGTFRQLDIFGFNINELLVAIWN